MKRKKLIITVRLRFKNSDEVVKYFNRTEDNGYEFVQMVKYRLPSFFRKGEAIALFRDQK